MALVGIPIRLLHEAESHVITVELKNSEIYRGMLLKSQDNMNLELTTVTHHCLYHCLSATVLLANAQTSTTR